jgi:hypothetical protein
VRTAIEDGTEALVGTYDIADTQSFERLVPSPDGQVAIIEDRRTRILTPDGRVEVVPVGGSGGAAFLPDGATLLVLDCDGGAVHVIDVASVTVADRFDVGGCPTFMDVDAGGSRLLLNNVGYDTGSRLELFDLPDGEAMGSIEIREQARAVRLEDANGGLTAIATGPFLDARWDVDPERWLARACELVGRNLTTDEWATHLGDEPYVATCDAYPAARPDPAPSAALPAPTTAPEPGASIATGGLCVPQEEACWQPPGRVRIDPFTPALGIDLDGSWEVSAPMGEDVVRLVHDVGQSVTLVRGPLPLGPDGAPAEVDPSLEGLVAWLESREGLRVGDVGSADLASGHATLVDVEVLSDTDLLRYPAADATYVTTAGQTIRFLLSMIGGETVVVAAEAPSDAFQEFWDAAASQLIESIEVE